MSDRVKQKQLVLNALKSGPRTTMQLISLGICCPTRRITELRRDHYQIETSKEKRAGRWVFIYTLEGHAAQAPALPPAMPVLALQRSDTRKEAICANSACGKPFKADRKTQRYCSSKCRYDDWDRKNPRLNFSTGSQQISTAFADARE